MQISPLTPEEGARLSAAFDNSQAPTFVGPAFNPTVNQNTNLTSNSIKSRLADQLIQFQPATELPMAWVGENAEIQSPPQYLDYAQNARGRAITAEQAASRIGVPYGELSRLMEGATTSNDPYGGIPKSVGIYPPARSSGGFFGFISDALDSIGSAVSDVGDFVSTTISNVLENPLPTIATIALTAVGVPAPIANGLVTAATGGNFEDVVISIGASYAGGLIGEAVGGALDPTAGLDFGDLYVPDLNQEFYQNIIINASDKAATAALQGKDFPEVLTAGLTGAVASAIGSSFGDELGDNALSIDDVDDISSNAATAILNDQDPIDVLAGTVDDYVNTYLTQGGDADLITNASDNVMTVLQQEHPAYFGRGAIGGEDLLDDVQDLDFAGPFQPLSLPGEFAPAFNVTRAGPQFDMMGPPLPDEFAPARGGMSFATLPDYATYVPAAQPLGFEPEAIDTAFRLPADDVLGNIQRYDDGSSLQIRNDGSMVVVDTDGQSTLYPADGGAPVVSGGVDTGPVINREVILNADTVPGAASVDQGTGVDTGPKITMTDVSQEPAGLASLDTKQAADSTDQPIINNVRDTASEPISNNVNDTGPNLIRDVTVDGESVGSSQIGDTQVYDDGSSLQIRNDGSMVVTDVDGTTTVYPGTNLPGASVVAGDQAVAAADATGSNTQVYDDGSSLTTNNDGSMTVTDTDGQTTLIPAVGASTSTVNDTSGAGNTQVFDDGSSITTMDDGSMLITDAEGNITSTPATNTTTNLANTVLSTGTNTQTYDDGSTLQTYDDGSMLATDADGNTNFLTSDDATGGTSRGITATDQTDKSLLDKAVDYAKENPLTVAGLGLGLLGGTVLQEQQPQDTTVTSEPVRKTYTYGEAPPIKATSLSELFRAASSAYTPYQVPIAQQQEMQIQRPVMGALLSGQAPGGFGLASLPARQVGPGQMIDISKLTPEQLNQLQSMLGPGV